MSTAVSSVSPGAGVAGREELLVFRGILILAIVLGHNRLVTGAWPMIFPLLYFWHVQGFFYEAVLQRNPLAMAGRRIGDVLVRYMVPFILFLVGATVVGTVFRPGEADPALLPRAIYDGFAQTCEAASGLALYWFLPTFASFSLVLIVRARVADASSKARIAFDALLGIAALAIAVLQPRGLAEWMPLGFLLGLCLVPLALAYRAVAGMALASPARTVATSVLAFCVAALQVHAIVVGGQRINISVYDFGTDLPHVLLAFAASLSMAFLVQVVARRLSGASWLRACGERSMVIYLLHPFVQFPLAAGLGGAVAGAGPVVQILCGVAVVAVTAGLCISAALLLHRVPALRTLVLPRDAAALAGLFRAGQAARHGAAS